VPSETIRTFFYVFFKIQKNTTFYVFFELMHTFSRTLGKTFSMTDRLFNIIEYTYLRL